MRVLNRAQFVVLAAVLPACNQLGALDPDGGGGNSVPPEVRAAFEESCGKSGCHGESGPTAPPLAGAALENLIGSQYVTIGDLAASQIALQLLPDAGLAELGVARPNPLRMPLDQDYYNPNVYIILAWISGAEFEGGGGETSTGGADETSTGGADETTTGGVDETTTGGELEPTWANVRDKVINASNCSCHMGTASEAANGGLILGDMAYEAIVGVPSNDFPDMDRITPMDPDNSYLYLKLTDAPGIMGMSMPQFGPLRPDADLELVKRWIEAGAPK